MGNNGGGFKAFAVIILIAIILISLFVFFGDMFNMTAGIHSKLFKENPRGQFPSFSLPQR